MGAAIAKLGGSALSAIIGGGLGSRARGVDAATATVRFGRFVYVAGIGYVAVTWYFGWRNERVEGDTGMFPVPYLYKGDKVRDGAPDAEGDDSLIAAVPGIGNAAPIPGVSSLVPGIGNAAGTARLGPGVGGNNSLLVRLGNTSKTFGLRPNEHPAFGGVNPSVHVQGSLHNVGRAIDCSCTPVNRETQAKAALFARWVVDNYGHQMTEVIWSGPNPAFVKNGKVVGPEVYKKVLASHKNHVHIAI